MDSVWVRVRVRREVDVLRDRVDGGRGRMGSVLLLPLLVLQSMRGGEGRARIHIRVPLRMSSRSLMKTSSRSRSNRRGSRGSRRRVHTRPCEPRRRMVPVVPPHVRVDVEFAAAVRPGAPKRCYRWASVPCSLEWTKVM